MPRSRAFVCTPRGAASVCVDAAQTAFCPGCVALSGNLFKLSLIFHPEIGCFCRSGRCVVPGVVEPGVPQLEYHMIFT